MTKKSKETQVSGNGHSGDNFTSEDALQAIANSITLMADRMDELEDRIQRNSATGEALLQMVNHFYNTDDNHIKELTNISALSVRPLSTAATMDKIGSPEVKSGEVSLVTLAINNFLRFRRSAGGRHFMLGIPVLSEQVQAQSEKEGEDFEAGGD